MEGRLLSVNPAAARALGYERQNGVGKNLVEFLAPTVRSGFPDYLRRMREHGQDSGHMLVVGRNRHKQVWLYRNLLVREHGSAPYVVGHAMDITEQKKIEYELQKALAEVKTLKGLLPVCAWCRRIRTEAGEWMDLEYYIVTHSNANFSHGVCPDCIPKIASSPGRLK